MNQRQARRLVWGNILALVDVNYQAGDGDLWLGLEKYEGKDWDRIQRAFQEALNELGRKAS